MRGRADQDAHIETSRLRRPGAIRNQLERCVQPHHAVGLSALVALGKTPRPTETQPKLIPAKCAQVCWVTHQKPRSAQNFKTHLRTRQAPPGPRAWGFAACTNHNQNAVGLAQEAPVQFRAARVAQAQNPGALGPECTRPCFSTKQSYPCFGQSAPVVVSRSRTSGTTKLPKSSIK